MSNVTAINERPTSIVTELEHLRNASVDVLNMLIKSGLDPAEQLAVLQSTATLVGFTAVQREKLLGMPTTSPRSN